MDFRSEPFKDFHVPTGALRKSPSSADQCTFLDGWGVGGFKNLAEFWKSEFLEFLQISTWIPLPNWPCQNRWKLRFSLNTERLASNTSVKALPTDGATFKNDHFQESTFLEPGLIWLPFSLSFLRNHKVVTKVGKWVNSWCPSSDALEPHESLETLEPSFSQVKSLGSAGGSPFPFT